MESNNTPRVRIVSASDKLVIAAEFRLGKIEGSKVNGDRIAAIRAECAGRDKRRSRSAFVGSAWSAGFNRGIGRISDAATCLRNARLEASRPNESVARFGDALNALCR